jgi:hypothetical protein
VEECIEAGIFFLIHFEVKTQDNSMHCVSQPLPAYIDTFREMAPPALLRIPLRAVNAAKVSARGTATVTKHPVTGSTPPSLDEFDPLNPGEWQLGVCSSFS